MKNREDRVVELNAVARRVIDEVRGNHPDQVFTYRGNAIETMHNRGWQAARPRAAKKYQDELGEPAPEGFKNIRVHDLSATSAAFASSKAVALTSASFLASRNR